MRAPPTLAPQPLERGADRGRVVREVVVDRDAAAPRRAPPCGASRRGSARAPRSRPRARRRRGARRRSRRARSRGCARPASGQRDRGRRRACQSTSNVPSVVRATRLASRSAAPKRSTGVQQPRASTRFERCVGAVGDDQRRSAARCARSGGTGVSIAARSGKMSAWSNSRLFRIAVARPVVDELRALVEERGVVLVGLDDEERAARRARADTPKSSGTPPMRKPGSRPACSRIQASIDAVVVLPCVPATASTQLAVRARARRATAGRRR